MRCWNPPARPRQRESSTDGDRTPPEVETPLLLSARSEPALRALALQWRGMLDAGGVDSGLVRGAAVSREQHKHRLVVSGRTHAALTAALADWLDGRGSHDVAAGAAVAGKVAFVFSGNGSQWPGMGLAAAGHNPTLPRRRWPMIDRHVAADARVVRAGPAGRPRTRAAVHDTSVAQPLLFATQVATVAGLREAGVQPSFFMGHSVGEVAAAWAAGSLSLDQACRVIAARSRLQSQTAGHGRMGVLALPAARAVQMLSDTGLELAAYNASNAITVAGPAASLDALAKRAARERVAFTALDLDHAFHSAAMDPIERPLLAELSDLNPPVCSPSSSPP